MMIADGVFPKNVDQGYILRRLIRRAIREFYKMNFEQPIISEIAKMYISKFENVYISVKNNKTKIIEELNKEEEKFKKTLLS
jgi:alanyl-tRNA synthetase